MKADIISIGTEIIMGELVDTNAQYLASRLPGLGIDLLQVNQVRDSIESLVSALRQSSLRSSLILTTGGLGPTDDDLTREAIGEFVGEVSYIDEDSLSVLQQTFHSRGWAMPSLNAKQARLIPSASTIKNTVGTAPGWWIEKDNLILIAMPGPPHEMRHMWTTEVEPSLTALSDDDITFTSSLKTTGIGESYINSTIAHLFHVEKAQLGIYANTQGIDIRIRVKAKTIQEAHQIMLPIEKDIYQRLGRYIWGENDQSLEELLGVALINKGRTLAVMESCTGGLLSDTITSVPGSSRYFIGGIVAYSNELKIKYGVTSDTINRFGAISVEVAQEMAHAARTSMSTDIGIGITGVAGPDSLEMKPVGTVHIAIEHQEFTDVFTHVYNGSRRHIQQRSVIQVVSKLLEHLKGL